MARKYELKQRAEQQAETRQRIVDAAMSLHREVGPAMASISAIAKRAGVQRLTVYRHFPDSVSLVAACSAQLAAEAPLPDPATWAEIAEPEPGLRVALRSFYDYFRRNAALLGHLRRDVDGMPSLVELLAPQAELTAAVAAQLTARMGGGGEGSARLAAAVAHALHFETWRSLAEEGGLDDAEAAELMVTLARAAREDGASAPVTALVAAPVAPTVRVLAAVIRRGDRYLVCQRPAHKRHGGLWEFPGGKLEPGETDEEAAHRELREELGVEVVGVGSTLHVVPDADSPFLIAFVPVQIAGEPACLEHSALAWGGAEGLQRLALAPSDRKFVEWMGDRLRSAEAARVAG